MKKLPLVSIIVRTCGRPHILRYALKSIQNQTYPNIEVIVVEDGINQAEDLLQNEFSSMDIKYDFTGKHVGRSTVGNRGLELASGKYISFLDDDDLIYKNHVTTLVESLERGQSSVTYSLAKECRVKKINVEPYYLVIKKSLKLQQPFNKVLLTNKNYLPIQSVMFAKTLYEEFGGFDVNLNQLEDWDLWVRYAMNVDFVYINQITSEYKVPIWGKSNHKRERELFESYQVVCEKFKNYTYHSDAYIVGKDVEYILSEYRKPLYWKCLHRIKQYILRGNLQKRHKNLIG